MLNFHFPNAGGNVDLIVTSWTQLCSSPFLLITGSFPLYWRNEVERNLFLRARTWWIIGALNFEYKHPCWSHTYLKESYTTWKYSLKTLVWNLIRITPNNLKSFKYLWSMTGFYFGLFVMVFCWTHRVRRLVLYRFTAVRPSVRSSVRSFVRSSGVFLGNRS